VDKLPVYRAVLAGKSSQDGVTAISLVESPAIGYNFIALEAETKALQFKADEPKYLLTGPALVPGSRIFRKDEQSGEGYFVMFEESTVELLSQQFAENQRTRSLTHQHTDSILDQTVVESWVVENPELDKSKALGFNVPKGTWMLSVKVTPDYWQKHIATGKIKGFSVEVSTLLEFNTKNKTDSTLDRFMNVIEKLVAKFEGEQPAEGPTETSFSAEVDGKPAIVTIDAKGRATYNDGKKTKPLKNGIYKRGENVYVVVDGRVQSLEEIQFSTNPDAATPAQLEAMTVLTPDGSAILLPEPNEQGVVMFDVTDAQGNVVGNMVFTPSVGAADTNPADSTEPVADPDEVASLSKALKEITGLLAEQAKATQALQKEVLTLKNAKVPADRRSPQELDPTGEPGKLSVAAYFAEKNKQQSN